MDIEKRKLIRAIIPAILMLLPMYIAMLLQWEFDLKLYFLGVHPLKLDGIFGIITSIFIHGDWGHLSGNTFPFFLFTTALFYYYPAVSKKVFIGMWITSGLYLWLFARGESWHIGASGLVYALAVFHLISAALQREIRLVSFSMLIIFLYGSMIWGFFPEFFPEQRISWQGHLTGAVVGAVFAVFFNKYAPKGKQYFLDEDDDDEINLDDPPYWM